MVNEFKEKSMTLCKKTKNVLNNKRGDLGTVGKLVITCIGLVFLLGTATYLFGWGQSKVEDTTKNIDTEYNNWNK